MGRSIRFFTAGTGTNSSCVGGKGMFGRRSSTSAQSDGTALRLRSLPLKDGSDSLRICASSASTASTGESSSHSHGDLSATSPLCTTAKENGSLSQRLMVRMNGESWNVSPRRGDLIASLRFPSHRDEMRLYDNSGQSCGVILPSTASPTSADSCFEYTLYSFESSFEKQPPSIKIEGAPSLFLYARIRAERERGTGDCACYNFTCLTETRRQFTADKVVWSTFRSRAFCVRETMANQDSTNAARVTCLTEMDREVLVYPRVDPMLMLGFVAVMEEVVLLSNL